MHRRRTTLPTDDRNDWKTLHTLAPFLWGFRGRIGLALLFLVCAKLANIGVPVTLKLIVDSLEIGTASKLLSIPLFLLIAYGLLRFSTSLFQELRDAVFAKAAQNSVRKVSLKVFRHLHQLALRFHLDRQTGGVSRDLERGSHSISQLLSYLVFSILPTIFEITVVCGILLVKFEIWFAVVTFVTVSMYFIYTYKVTEWRIKFRVQMNELDSLANTAAIDSLINYETVKYFCNEDYEAERYDAHLKKWEKASIKSRVSLALLNVGQGVIIGTGLTVLLIMAARGVITGQLTLGDFVMVNAFLIQLYIPLNFLGTIFREVKHCLTDMEKMLNLLDVTPEIKNSPAAKPLTISSGSVEFHNVAFAYRPDRKILNDVNFSIPAGHKVAVVGSSGAGKSTLARLIFRFYEVSGGTITVDGQDIRDVTLESLRSAIGIVPQDTVLFNDTIAYNIQYGRPDASFEEIHQAAIHAQLHQFISSLPDGYETRVGERGLKLSGGEKQRIAIARTLLKNPPILILDEATSALDSRSEKAIQAALATVASNRTTLIIAHRLSTVVDADEILVLENGQIIERGTHRTLLETTGHYADMWRLQLERQELEIEQTALQSA